MVHAPYHLAYVVECAYVKVPWSSNIHWFSVSAGIQFRFLNVWRGTHSKSGDLVIAPLTCFRGWTTVTGGTGAQSTRSLFAPSSCYKISLCFAKCRTECSCRHAVSHFKPEMMLFEALLISLWAVYPLTPLRLKISLCSVSVWEVFWGAGSKSRPILQLRF